LKLNGYQILENNFYCRQGEIDIIASREDTLVLIEVKTRNNFYYGKPAEAVGKKKIKHIYYTAKYYIYLKKPKIKFVRFDLLEVVLKGKGIFIYHSHQII